MTETVTEGLRAALTANRVEVRGPVLAGDATEHVVGRALLHSAGAAVAVSPADRLVGALGIVEGLRGAGVDVLLPGDAEWRGRLPAAGLGVTGSLLAVAETGSLALAAGPGSPRGVSLLPPVHLCLVAVADIVANFAEAITKVANAPLPSALTWVGGPSRTGDLEMIQTLGVHGPSAVEVILVR
ncbi:MAG: LutC/YkgG family protein [Acidimicrobiia bacterium]